MTPLAGEDPPPSPGAAPSGAARDVAAELVAALYRRIPGPLAVNTVNAALTAVVMRGIASDASLLAWLAAMVLMVAARALLWWRYRRAGPGPAPAVWGWRYALGAAAAGLLWGAGAVLFFPPASPPHQVFLAFVIGGMTAGAMASLTAFLPAFYAFAIPALVPLATVFYVQRGAMSTVMGAMLTVFGVAVCAIAHDLHHTQARALRLAAEKAEMAGVLVAATEAAASADRVKASFLASMGHELRTPLNAVIGFSEIIKDEMFGELGNRLYRDYANLIHASAEHLLDLINEILDLSRAEAGRLELFEEAVDLRRVIEVCVNLTAARAGPAAAKVTAQIAPDIPGLRADARRLKQILLNLLTNAIKFTPGGGRVTVGAACDAAGRIVVSVADTGIGMSSADIEKALRPFAQVEDTLARRFPGAGIGLPLTKMLVELHGGDLTIESAPGAGTSVTVRFPSERTVRAAPPAGLAPG